MAKPCYEPRRRAGHRPRSGAAGRWRRVDRSRRRQRRPHDRRRPGSAGGAADNPAYTLRRVWLSREEERGYYHGFANEGLWPLCHLAHERPVFRASNWEHYLRVNQRFAAAALEEVGTDPAVVLVQDYHLALVPRLLKDARPDLAVGLFWHIPGPTRKHSASARGELSCCTACSARDLIGFHLQQYCNNFLDTADRMTEARLDWDRLTVRSHDHVSRVRPFPSVSNPGASAKRRVAFVWPIKSTNCANATRWTACGSRWGIDRIDYTKGYRSGSAPSRASWNTTLAIGASSPWCS